MQVGHITFDKFHLSVDNLLTSLTAYPLLLEKDVSDYKETPK